MSIQNVAKVALLTGLVAVLAGCGGTPPPTAEPVEVEVTLQEFKVESDLTAFQVGTPYHFVITNKGVLAHEFVLEGAGVVDEPLEANGEVGEVEDISPAATVTFDWTFDTAGDYQMACHVPAHYEAGMVTTFTVQ